MVANVNGIEYTRIRPKKRSSSPTAKQLLIQQRMKDSITFMQSYRAYACNHYGHRVGAKSRYNLALTNTLQSMQIDYAANTITLDYNKIMFSRGTLMAPIPLTLDLTTATTLQITWQNNAAGNPERENDNLQILMAAEGDLNTYFIENAATRIAQTYTVNLPVSMQGKTLHVYLAFKSADETTVSNSQYAGAIN